MKVALNKVVLNDLKLMTSDQGARAYHVIYIFTSLRPPI